MVIATIGIDLAKDLFAIHGVNETGKSIWVNPKVARDQRFCRDNDGNPKIGSKK